MPDSATIRTTTAPPDVRRQLLIETMIMSARQNGKFGAAMTAITQRAGRSPGLVDYHFKRKAAALNAAVLRLAQVHRTLWLTRAAKPDLEPERKIMAIIKARFSPRICNRKRLAVWFAFLREAANRKSYRTVAPEEVANTTGAKFDGFRLNRLRYPDTFTRTDAAARIIAYLARTFPVPFSKLVSQ